MWLIALETIIIRCDRSFKFLVRLHKVARLDVLLEIFLELKYMDMIHFIIKQVLVCFFYGASNSNSNMSKSSYSSNETELSFRVILLAFDEWDMEIVLLLLIDIVLLVVDDDVDRNTWNWLLLLFSLYSPDDSLVPCRWDFWNGFETLEIV